MKKALVVLTIAMMFSGCSPKNQELERMMDFRASLLSAMGCEFTAEITADYQEEVYQFSLDCSCNENGTLHFTVTAPESIAGIGGEISGQGGKLTFSNDTGLAFGTIADGQVTPITASWLLVKTLRGGYVTSCGMEGDLVRVSIDDSYQEDALHLDIWFDNEMVPNHAEILWKDRRVLSLEIKNFNIL